MKPNNITSYLTYESVNTIFQFIKHNLDNTRFNIEKNDDSKQ